MEEFVHFPQPVSIPEERKDKQHLPSNNLAMMLSMLSLSVSAIILDAQRSQLYPSRVGWTHQEPDDNGYSSTVSH